MALEENSTEEREEYDGSRVLVTAITLLGILVLVPWRYMPGAILLWTMMIFALSLGVQVRQVWIVRVLACLTFLVMVLLLTI